MKKIIREDTRLRNLINNPMKDLKTKRKQSHSLKKTWKNDRKRFKNTPLFEKGEHFSPKTEFKKGQKSWITGRNHTKKAKKKLSIAKKGKLNPEHSLRMLRENNPNWKGGITFEPYGIEFDKDLKDKIRERDNFTCQICSIDEQNLKRKLSIHHIDYDKQNNKEENLISLCNICHCKTEYNRLKWILYFQTKLNKMEVII